MGNAVENEYKFTSDDVSLADDIVDDLRTFLLSHGVVFSEKTRTSVDSYFDTADLQLYRMDCILRRKVSQNGKCKLTVKRPISNSGDMMSRQEIEIVSSGELGEIMDFAYEHFPDLDISEVPSLTIESERTAFSYQDGSEIKLSLDVCRYIKDGRHRDFLEIELESMDKGTRRGFDTIGIIGHITTGLGFVCVTESKYRRGVAWYSGQASPNEQI